MFLHSGRLEQYCMGVNTLDEHTITRMQIDVQTDPQEAMKRRVVLRYLPQARAGRPEVVAVLQKQVKVWDEGHLAQQ